MVAQSLLHPAQASPSNVGTRKREIAHSNQCILDLNSLLTNFTNNQHTPFPQTLQLDHFDFDDDNKASLFEKPRR